jgi:hypothetical protein
MGLPAGGFHEVFQGGATGPLHQVQHFGRFAARANTLSRRRRGFVSRFGALLGRGRLVRRLGLAGRNTGLGCGDFGLLGRLRLLGGGGLGRFSICNDGRRHVACSFSGDYRSQDMDHSAAFETQAISEENWERRWNGDASRNAGTHLAIGAMSSHRSQSQLTVSPPRFDGAGLSSGFDPN